MKNLARLAGFRTIFTILVFNLMQTLVWGQDSGSTSSTTTHTTTTNTQNAGNWYASPWVWVVGAAILILLIVALSSGGKNRGDNGRTDKITVTKTVRRDSDTDPA